jgi:hypothetical protein
MASQASADTKMGAGKVETQARTKCGHLTPRSLLVWSVTDEVVGWRCLRCATSKRKK